MTGLVFVISAPAGTGKTTLVRMLREEFPNVVQNISYTTRLPRPNETPNRDYYFIHREKFEEKIRKGEFLEYAKVFDHFYGTSLKTVEKLQNEGKHVILVIDTQGALQIRNKLAAIFIFITPPSLEELKIRLTERKADSNEEIELRLSWAKKEMGEASKYDYHIVNDNLKEAYNVFRSILIAEEHRNR